MYGTIQEFNLVRMMKCKAGGIRSYGHPVNSLQNTGFDILYIYLAAKLTSETSALYPQGVFMSFHIILT